VGLDPVTFLLELANFAVLVWVLQRLVYRPLQRGITERRRALAEERESTARLQERAEERLALAEQRLAEIEKLRDGAIAEARELAAAERARILAQAREDTAAERERVHSLLEHERESARGWVREAVIDGSLEVASRLLLELAPDALEEALLKMLEAAIARQAAELGGELVRGEAIDAELVVAKGVREAATGRVRRALEQTLGSAPRLTVREDEALIAGFALALRDRLIDASLGGKLSELRARARELAETEPEP